MTVESQKRRQIVNGTGGTGPYPFTDIPLYDAEDDLAVYIELDDGTLTDRFTVNVDYTIAYSDQTDAGSVTFATREVETDEKVVMVRETEITQGIRLSRSGTIDTSTYEGMVDKTTLQNIDQQDELDRSLRVSIAQVGDFDAEIRAVTSTDSGRAIVVNDAGNGYSISTTNVNDIDDAVEQAAASATAAAGSASAASDSATQAGTSATNAAASATAASEDAQRAEDAVSSIQLPNPAVANTYIRRNAGNTAYITQTTNEVKSDLGVDTIETQIQTINTSLANKVTYTDWDNAVSYSTGTTHTAPSDGWVRGVWQVSGAQTGQRWMTIEGAQVFALNKSFQNATTADANIVPVKSGQTFNMQSGNTTLAFYPALT